MKPFSSAQKMQNPQVLMITTQNKVNTCLIVLVVLLNLIMLIPAAIVLLNKCPCFFK